MAETTDHPGLSASERITEKIAALGGWRGATLARMRQLILEAAAFQALITQAVALNHAGKPKAAKKAKAA